MGAAYGGLNPQGATSGTVPWSAFEGFVANTQTPVVLLETRSGWLFAIEPPGAGPTRLWAKALLGLGLTDRNPELTAAQSIAPPTPEPGVRERGSLLREAVETATKTVASHAWRIDLPPERRWGYGRRGPNDPGPTNALLATAGVAATAFAEVDEGGVVSFEACAYASRDGSPLWRASIPPPFNELRSDGGTVRVGDGELLLTIYVDPRARPDGDTIGVVTLDAATGAARSWTCPFGSDPFALPPDGGGYLAEYPGDLRRLDADGRPVWTRPNVVGQRVRGLPAQSGLLDTFGSPQLQRYTLLAQYGSEHGITILDAASGQPKWSRSLPLAPSMVGLVTTAEGPLLLCPNWVLDGESTTTALLVENGEVAWVRPGDVRPVQDAEGLICWSAENGEIVTVDAISGAEVTAVPDETPGAAWVLDGVFTTTLLGAIITAQVPAEPDCLLGPAEVVRTEDRLVVRTPSSLLGLALP